MDNMQMQIPAPRELAEMIPMISQVELAFPAGKNIDRVYDRLTPIAREWSRQGLDTWGGDFFGRIFSRGGKVPPVNTELDGVTGDDIDKVLLWLRAAMGSFYPQHEDKEVVCGMLWQTFFVEPEVSDDAPAGE